MKNKRKQRAQRPAPAPTKSEKETVEQLRASISQLVEAVNGALNTTTTILKRRMDEGFRNLEEFIGERWP